MPGGSLKLNTVAASIYCSPKPYNHLRPITSAAVKRKFPAVPPRAWWRRITIPPLTHHRILHHQFFLGFRLERYSSHLAVRSISNAHMGSNPDNKEDQWLDASSPTPPLPNNRRRMPSARPPQSSKLLTLPTILTIGRVAAVPLLVSTFYVESWWGPAATTGIFIAASITDWLDGYIARKLNLGTAFGAFLDPVADKLMVAATLVLLCTRPLEVFGQFPWLLTVPSIAIIGREITMSAVREWAASQGSKLSEAVAVNNLGKWKTATQMTALTILLATRDSSLVESGTLAGSGMVLLYISAWLAIWSLVVYMKKISKVLLL